MPFVVGALFIAVCLFVAWFRQQAALVNTFDTGIYLQLAHNLAHNWDGSSSLTAEHTFLAHHFQPTAWLTVPFVALSATPFTLFFLSALAITTAFILFPREAPLAKKSQAMLFGLVLITLPSVAYRAYYSFTPEIFALPSMIYLCQRLTSKKTGASSALLWLNLILLGCAKENYWLTVAGFCLAFSVTAPRKERWPFMVATCASLGVFAALFFWWMPAHRSHSTYYATVFYPFLAQPTLWQKFSSWCSVLTSTQSLLSLARLVLFPGLGLALLGPGRLLAPLLPGLMQILSSPSLQVQHPANQYALLCDPIVCYAAWLGWKRLPSLWPQRPRLSRLLLVLISTSLLYSLNFEPWAPLPTALTAVTSPSAVWQRRSQFRALTLPPDAAIVAEDFLPPIFPEWRNVRVLLSYPGVAAAADPETLATTRFVVTQLSPNDLQNCPEATLGLAHLLPQLNTSAFLSSCEIIDRTFKENPALAAANLHIFEHDTAP